MKAFSCGNPLLSGSQDLPPFRLRKTRSLFSGGHRNSAPLSGMTKIVSGSRGWIASGNPKSEGKPAIHPREPETIFVIPLKGAEFRCPPENKLRVFRSRNGGKSWESLSKGLPQENAF